MDFVFETLFKIDFRHQYFGNQIFSGFNITTNDKTKCLLLGLDMGYKLQQGRLVVYYNTNFAGNKREKIDLLNKYLVISFNIEITDKDFLSYTSIPTYEPFNHIIHFHNKKSLFNTTPRKKGFLHRDFYVSKENLRSLSFAKEIGLKKPQAIINILLNPAMEEQYIIQFAAKSTFWQYTLVSDFYKDLNNPRIISINKKKLFKEPQKIQLPDGKEGITFVSEEMIVHSENSNKSFQLVEEYDEEKEKYKIVIQTLPNPDVKHISLLSNSFNPNKDSLLSHVFL